MADKLAPMRVPSTAPGAAPTAAVRRGSPLATAVSPRLSPTRRAAKRAAAFRLGVPQPDGSTHELQCSVLPYKLLVAGVRHELVGPHLQPLLSLLYFPSGVRPRFVAYSQTDGDVTVLVDEACGAALDGLAGALSGSPLPYCAIEVFEGSSALNMTGLIATLSEPLADADLPLIYLSTFNTDLVLVEQERLEQAVQCLTRSFPTRPRAAPDAAPTGEASGAAVSAGAGAGEGTATSASPGAGGDAGAGASTMPPLARWRSDSSHGTPLGDGSDWRGMVARDASSCMDLSAEQHAPPLLVASLAKSRKHECCYALTKALFFAASLGPESHGGGSSGADTAGGDRDDGAGAGSAQLCPFRAYVETEDDISLILPRSLLAAFPDGALVVHPAPWRSVHIAKGAVPFADSRLVSVLAVTLAHAKVPIYYFGTYASDYVLVEEGSWRQAVEGLRTQLSLEVEMLVE